MGPVEKYNDHTKRNGITDWRLSTLHIIQQHSKSFLCEIVVCTLGIQMGSIAKCVVAIPVLWSGRAVMRGSGLSSSAG